MTKPGMRRPVVIPKKNALKEDIVLGIAKTIGLSRSDIQNRLTKRRVSARAAKKSAS